MGDGTVYYSSEGAYFGDADIWERFESGVWTPCCWDPETGREWVKTRDGDLLLLVAVSRYALPDDVIIKQTATGLKIRETHQNPAD